MGRGICSNILLVLCIWPHPVPCDDMCNVNNHNDYFFFLEGMQALLHVYYGKSVLILSQDALKQLASSVVTGNDLVSTCTVSSKNLSG